MRHFYPLLILLLFNNCDNTEMNPHKPDIYFKHQKTLEDFNLKGLVKSVSESTFPIYTSIDETLDWEDYVSRGNADYYRFDKQGRMIEKFYDGKKWFYQYNQEGKLSKAIRHKRDKKSVNKTTQLVFEYGEYAPYELKKIERDEKLVYLYSYDDNYNCTKMEYFGDENVTHNYTYDDKDRVTLYGGKKISYSGNTVIDSIYGEGGDVDKIGIHTFDGDKLISYGEHPSYSRTQKIVNYEYNRQDDVVKKYNSEFTPSTQSSSEQITNYDPHKFDYIYDIEDNWLRRIEYFEGKVINVTIRKVEYYKKRYFGILK